MDWILKYKLIIGATWGNMQTKLGSGFPVLLVNVFLEYTMKNATNTLKWFFFKSNLYWPMLNLCDKSRHPQWLTLVVPATWDAELEDKKFDSSLST